MIQALLIEANARHAQLLADHITRAAKDQLELSVASSLAASFERLDRGGIDVVLLDCRMPGAADATEAIASLYQRIPAVPIVALGPGDQKWVRDALHAGALWCLRRDRVTGEALVQAMCVAVERQAKDNAAQALQTDNEARIEAIINAAMDCIITMDPDSRILQFNKAAETTFGYSAAEVVGKEMGELFMPPDVRQRQKRSFQLYQTTGFGSMLGRRVETSAYRKDGTQFIAEMATQPVKMHGALVFTIFLRDVTQERRAEEALQAEIAERRSFEEQLRRERDLLRTLMDHLPDFVFAKDIHDRFVTANDVLLSSLGIASHTEIVGKSDDDLFDSELARQFRDDDRRVMESGEPLLNREEIVPGVDGATRWMLTTKVPLRNASGDVEGLVGICRDITDRKQATEELEKAKEAAEAANQAKGAFLATMSHEIRTPMNGVLGMAELLLDTRLTPTQQEYIEMLRDSGETLLSLLNDILDFSKIEAGKLEFEREPFQLRDRLAVTMKTLALRAHLKSLELACRFDPNVPDLLVGDVNRLRQVLINLVGNAIKFTHQGEVVLDIQCLGIDGDQAELQFSVRDTGVGIPADKLERIFSAFEQADVSTTREFGGTGLGLAISRRLVELMGGRLWAESAVGSGSVFRFTSRFECDCDGDTAQASPLDLSDTPVLVVDDNATNRKILTAMLAKFGMRPTAAAGAEEAMNSLLQARAAQRPFPLVISDVNMPGVDGFTLAQNIKRHEQLRDTRVVLLTSATRQGDLARCEELGVNDHLMKPVGHSELLESVVRTLRHGNGQPREPVKRGKVAPLDILLVEDSVVNQRLAQGLLKRDGHRVTVANNGREAVDALQSRDFDAVLMDLSMPEMDGLQATAVIRQREAPSGRRTPIIAMTAHAMTGDRERCLEAGMDDYITKPIRAELLYECLNCLMAQEPESNAAERADTAADTAADPAADDAVAAPADDDAMTAVRLAFLESVDHDREIAAEIGRAFLEEFPQLVAGIRQAIDEENAAQLSSVAHTLQGVLRVFPATAACNLAIQLETMGASGQTHDANSVFDQLYGEVEPLRKFLSHFVS